jgi:hypothetical protein
VSGTAGGRNRSLTNATLRADALTFGFDEDGKPVKVAARVKGDRIEADVTRDGKTSKYVGTRKT